MKILTTIHIQKVAGITHYISSLADYIKKIYAGKEIELVGINVAKMDYPGADDEVASFRENNWKLYSISAPHKKIIDAAATANGLNEFELLMEPIIREHEKVIAAEKPDIILLSGTYHLIWCLYVAAMRAGSKKIVLHYHGLLHKEVEKYDKRVREIYRRMEESYFGGVAFYVFPSSLALREVEKNVFRRPVGDHMVLPNPIGHHFFKDRPPEKDNTDTVGFPVVRANRIINAGYVGRWTREKNPQFILRLAGMNSKISGKLGIYAVTGLDPESREYKMIGKKIKLLPPVANDAIGNFYQAMDVVVCPSYFETYGNVAQESIAAGTPALISPNMGVAETFREFGLDYLITDFKSTRKVIDKINRVASYDITRGLRDELKNKLAPEAIYKRLLGALRSL